MSERQPQRQWPRGRGAVRAAWGYLVFGLAMMGESFVATVSSRSATRPNRPHRTPTPCKRRWTLAPCTRRWTLARAPGAGP